MKGASLYIGDGHQDGQWNIIRRLTIRDHTTRRSRVPDFT